jgi:hypothetical protein
VLPYPVLHYYYSTHGKTRFHTRAVWIKPFPHPHFYVKRLRFIITAYSVNNTFDAGYPSGGNYWSDYNGSDADHDGIGDTQHMVFENVVDHYPLMNPFTTESVRKSEAASQQNSPTSSESEDTVSSTGPADETPISTDDGNPIKPAISSLSVFSIAIGALLYTSIFGLFFASLYFIRRKH